MEIDLSNAEKSEQVTWSSSSSRDDQDLLGHARSYSCSFCKRGFSNAQALGGHMNVHRKDRARLKGFLSLDITKRDDSSDPSNNPPHPSSVGDRHDLDTPERASPSPDQSGDHQLQLSLFTETSSSSNHKDERLNRVNNRHVKRSMQFSHGESAEELDLELRLGPDSQEALRKG